MVVVGVILERKREPLGVAKNNQSVWLKDIWPSSEEIHALMRFATNADTFRQHYSNFTKNHDLWDKVTSMMQS